MISYKIIELEFSSKSLFTLNQNWLSVWDLLIGVKTLDSKIDVDKVFSGIKPEFDILSRQQLSKPGTDHRLVVPGRPRLQLTYSVVFSGVRHPRLIRLFVARCFKSCVHPCTKFNLLALSFRFTACFASTFNAFCYFLFVCFFISFYFHFRSGPRRLFTGLAFAAQRTKIYHPSRSTQPLPIRTYIYLWFNSVILYIFIYSIYFFLFLRFFLVLLVVCSMPWMRFSLVRKIIYVYFRAGI